MFQTKDLPVELMDLKANAEEMVFSGYAAVFKNVDHGNDVLLPGAFDETLQRRSRRPLLWQHDLSSPLGVEQSLKVDDHGLFGTWKISRTTLGLDAFQLVRDHAVGAMSIGYLAEKTDYDGDVRILKKVDLLENSIVTLGMNEQAVITGVKALADIKALIEAGLLSADDFKAEWTAAYVNNLPDSAFAVILPGGEKDSDGKTTPRSLRKLPHHAASGKLDMAHLRNAMSREPQTDMPDAMHGKAHSHLQGHMSGGKTLDLDVPFDVLLGQLVEGVTYGTTEAEALWTRRLADGREPKAEHLAAVTSLREAVEAASARLTALLSQKSEVETDDEGLPDDSAAEAKAEPESAPSADLSLRLELARARLRVSGVAMEKTA